MGSTFTVRHPSGLIEQVGDVRLAELGKDVEVLAEHKPEIPKAPKAAKETDGDLHR